MTTLEDLKARRELLRAKATLAMTKDPALSPKARRLMLQSVKRSLAAAAGEPVTAAPERAAREVR